MVATKVSSESEPRSRILLDAGRIGLRRANEPTIAATFRYVPTTRYRCKVDSSMVGQKKREKKEKKNRRKEKKGKEKKRKRNARVSRQDNGKRQRALVVPISKG